MKLKGVKRLYIGGIEFSNVLYCYKIKENNSRLLEFQQYTDILHSFHSIDPEKRVVSCIIEIIANSILLLILFFFFFFFFFFLLLLLLLLLFTSSKTI